MLDHLAIGVRDMAASRAFYEAALAPLGFAVVMERDDRIAFGPTQRPIFFLVDREPTERHPHRLPGERPRSRRRVPQRGARRRRRTTTAAPACGPQYHPHYYGAFVLDPDGNNAEAVCHTPQ